MKIAIVNDLLLASTLLNELIQRRTKHTIIWTACDGEDAFKKCMQSKPDILLMDLIMPKMNGVSATREIMQKCPCAILLVTANVEKNVSLVFEAMGAGALDVVKTPSFDIHNLEVENEELLQKIDNIALLIEDKEKSISFIPLLSSSSLKARKPPPPLLLIGASTGGPTAIRTILKEFPKSIPFSTIIVQHIDPEFAGAFVSWLQEKTFPKISLIKEPIYPEAGEVFVASEKKHLVLTPSMQLTYLPENQFVELPNRPSIDVFFESILRYQGIKGIACLLTGMGRDGAKGLLALKEYGFETIAEDATTSIVYGMPKAALTLNAVHFTLPIDRIGGKILDLMNRPFA